MERETASSKLMKSGSSRDKVKVKRGKQRERESKVRKVCLAGLDTQIGHTRSDQIRGSKGDRSCWLAGWLPQADLRVEEILDCWLCLYSSNLALPRAHSLLCRDNKHKQQNQLPAISSSASKSKSKPRAPLAA